MSRIAGFKQADWKKNRLGGKVENTASDDTDEKARGSSAIST
jgi:hypothetical protein